MERSEKEIELEKLEFFKRQITRTRMSKHAAHSILRDLSAFNTTFWKEYPLLTEYYKRNSTAEIYISDGTTELEQYANSKLVRKDDRYFDAGIRNVIQGLDFLIFHLNEDVE
jgi:hypothetical protein